MEEDLVVDGRSVERDADPRATPAEIQILTLIWEQFAVPMDLLPVLLGMDPIATDALMKNFAKRRWVKIKQFLANDEAWVWLRKRGAEQCGPKVPAKGPYLKLLPHHRAACEARIRLEERYPDGQWICERRVLGNDHKSGFHIPDAIFRMPDGKGGVKQWAIEVELTPKNKKNYPEIVGRRCARYDRVIYFCPSRVAQILREVPAMSHIKVRVIGSLQTGTDSANFQWKVLRSSRTSRAVRESMEEWEAEIVRLIVDQLAIPMDQFAQFLGRDMASARQVAGHLEEAGFIWRGRGFVDEAPWLLATTAGAILAKAGPDAPKPRVIGSQRLRDINEARILVQERAPNAIWRPARMLEKRASGTSDPIGILVSGGREYAVEVQRRLAKRDKLRKKYQRLYAKHQRKNRDVVVVCPPLVAERLGDLKRKCGWTNLSVEVCDTFSSRRERG